MLYVTTWNSVHILTDNFCLERTISHCYRPLFIIKKLSWYSEVKLIFMPPWLEYAFGDFKFRPKDMGLVLRTVGSLRDTDASGTATILCCFLSSDLTFWRAIYKTGKLGRKWECSLSTVVCAYTVECLNMTNFTPLWHEMCREMDENFSLERNATAGIAVKLSPCSDIHHISNISCSLSTVLRNLSYLLACYIYNAVRIHLFWNYNG